MLVSVSIVTLGGSVLFLLFGFIYLYEAWSEFNTPTGASTQISQSTIEGLANAAENVAAMGGGLAAPAPPVVDYPHPPAPAQPAVAQPAAENANLAEAMAAAIGRRTFAAR